jgi:hypothetical protein
MVSVPAVNSALLGGGLTLAVPAGGVVVVPPQAASRKAAAIAKMRALILLPSIAVERIPFVVGRILTLLPRP